MHYGLGTGTSAYGEPMMSHVAG